MAVAFFLFGGAVLALAIGVTYWARTYSHAPLWQRLLASAYGPTIAVVFVVAAFLWPESHHYQPEGVRAFLLLHLLPLGLFVYSLCAYPGPRSLHVFLVPPALIAWLWTLAIGYIFVHGM
jgi:hypothetical protein